MSIRGTLIRRTGKAGLRSQDRPLPTYEESMMSARFQRITPFLWFDKEAEQAATFYTAIFDDSRITATTRYTKEASQASGQSEGTVMTVAFELDGQKFTAINGGPVFKFNEAISLVVHCESQEELDRYWDALSKGGEPRAQQCGWLKDRYGLSWQIVPADLPELIGNPTNGKRAMAALMQMKKIDIQKLRDA
jgi:predicted 3-demethylubiquinone-9 3-methyltransferase (glyoxalase superfamily)